MPFSEINFQTKSIKGKDIFFSSYTGVERKDPKPFNTGFLFVVTVLSILNP